MASGILKEGPQICEKIHQKGTRRWGGGGEQDEASAIILAPKGNAVVPVTSSAFSPGRWPCINLPARKSPEGLLICMGISGPRGFLDPQHPCLFNR